MSTFNLLTFSSREQVMSEPRSVTCHMGSHIVTFHPTQVNTPRLHPSQTGWYSIYLPRRDGRLSWPRWRFIRPQTVTHPSSNRAQCWATTLIKTNVLTLHHADSCQYTGWDKKVGMFIFAITLSTASQVS